MTKTLGYYDTKNREFVGTPKGPDPTTTARLIFTLRTTDGVCYGEYDSITGEFIPQTNPYTRDPRKVFLVDEDVDSFKQGRLKMNVLDGGEVDTGAEVARKNLHPVAIPKTIQEVKPIPIKPVGENCLIKVEDL